MLLRRGRRWMGWDTLSVAAANAHPLVRGALVVPRFNTLAYEGFTSIEVTKTTSFTTPLRMLKNEKLASSLLRCFKNVL